MNDDDDDSDFNLTPVALLLGVLFWVVLAWMIFT